MKNIIVCLLVWSAATAIHAYDDSYMPKGHRLGEKYAYDLQNMYFAHSPDRAQTVEPPVNITNFNYDLDGKWAYGISLSELYCFGEPACAFGGGNDKTSMIDVWFYSPSTGLRVVNEEPYTGRLTVWVTLSKADDGTLFAAWANSYYAEKSGTIFMAKSLDSGKTWTPKVDVGALLKAYDPIDTAMNWPKLAPRAIDGLHLIWLDDHKNPGSSIQNVGTSDTAFIKYAKINVTLDGVMGLDNGVNNPDSDRVVTMGWTSYDWVTTGCSQGVVVDDIQNMGCVWTRGTIVPYSSSAARYAGFNSYAKGAGVGNQTEISPSTSGFPCIALATGGANGQLPAVVYHRSNSIRSIVDQGGVGGGMWTSERTIGMTNYIWPSIAFPGGTAADDSIAAVGNYYTGNNNGVALAFHCDAVSPDRWILIGDSSLSGTGVYNGIVASPNTPDMWVFFNGQGSRNAPPWAPTLHDTIHYPTADSIGLYWDMHTYTNDATDSFKLYMRVNASGTWNVVAAFDTIGSPAIIVYNVEWPTGTDTNSYYITAHDANGWSQPSNIVSVAWENEEHWPPYPPPLAKTLHVPTIDSMEIKWPRKYSSADFVDFYTLYHKLNGGVWSIYATFDTVTYHTDTIRYHVAIAINASDTNYYTVSAHNYDGEGGISNIVNDRTPVGISAGPDAQHVSNFILHQNSPNPAQGPTRISFDLPHSGRYTLQIYNMAGQQVASFEGLGNAGVNLISWGLTDAQGHKVPNGVYVYQIYSAYGIRTRKMVILR